MFVTRTMLKFVLAVLLFQNNCCVGQKVHHPKCCDGDSAVKKNGTVYRCVKNSNVRFEIVTNDTNFALRGINGYCVDVEEKFNFFKMTDDGLIKDEKIVNVDVIPKCCPAKHYYNTTTHSCTRTDNPLDGCFSDKVVKIGLPNCKIIEDFKLGPGDFGCFSELSGKYKDGHYCVDRDETNVFSVLRTCGDDYDTCDHKKCVHKCCPDGQSFVNGSNCKNTYVHGIDLSFSNNIQKSNVPFAIIHGYSPPVYILRSGYFTLDQNGAFSHYENLTETTTVYGVEEYEYCIEYFEKNNISGYSFFRPFPSSPILTKFIFTRYAMAISCVFLVLTIAYYFLSREKRTVFGKTLISYCCVSLLLFVLLSYSAFDIRSSEKLCRISVWFLLYGTLATFSWMNVMCIDIYWTFGSSKSFSSLQHKSKELKRFMLYSLYGWGFPMVLTAIPLIFYHVDVLPPALKLLVDGRKCYIQRGHENYALLLFSTAPIALGEIFNSILFVKTIIYCLKVKGEISKMNDTHTLKGEKTRKFNKYKDRLSLLIKLFLIMGVSFLFEVVSSFFDLKKNDTTAHIELVWDTFNSLQGLFIFVIFVFKKRIFKKCQKKIGLPERLRKFSLISSATTQTTVQHHNENGTKKY